jgi:hypothetical protein
VLGQRPAVVTGARPVAVGDLGNDVAAFLERFEHHSDVELHPERVFDADLYVVEVDENRDLQSCVCQNLPVFPLTAAFIAAPACRPSFYYVPRRHNP